MLALSPVAFADPDSRRLLIPDSEREPEYHPDPHGWEFCSIAQALATLGEEWTRRERLERCLIPDGKAGRVLEDERGLWLARLEIG